MRRNNFSRSLLGVSQFLAILVANCLLCSGQMFDVTKQKVIIYYLGYILEI